MLKRIVVFALVIGVLLSLITVNVSATAVDTEYGTFEYTVLSDDTVRIDKVIPVEEPPVGLCIPEQLDGRIVTAIGDKAYPYAETLPFPTVIPRSIVSVGEDVFSGLDDLSVAYGGTEEEWQVLCACAGDGNAWIDTTRVEYQDSKTPFRYTVTANGDAHITQYTGDTDVTVMSVPATVGGRAVRSVGSEAYCAPLFSECTALERIEWPPCLMSIGEVSLAGSALKEIALPDGVMCYSSNGAARGCFEACEQLSDAVLPEQLYEIPSRSFASCVSLGSVTLFANCNTVWDNAFWQCDALSDVYFIGTEAQWNALTVCDGNDALLAARVHCSEEASAVGDMNTDGIRNMSDAMTLYTAAAGRSILTVYQQHVGDIDRGGQLNMADCLALYREAAGV